MSNRIIIRHSIGFDEHGPILEPPLEDVAPRGWFSVHLFASLTPPPPAPKRRKKKGERGRRAEKEERYEELFNIMKAARGERDREGRNRLFWESGQIKRDHAPFPLTGPTAGYMHDRDDPRSFQGVRAALLELLRELPGVTSVSAEWLIHPPYLEEDMRRDAEAAPPERHRRGAAERVFREYVRQAMISDPSWIPDYAQLATLFPDLAPRERPDGTRIKDRTWILRLIVSEERKALGLKPPAPPKSARERLLELFDAGLDRDAAAATLRREGHDVSREYVLAVWRELSRPPVPQEEVLVEVPPGVPVEVVVEPGGGPVEIEAPPEVVITHRPAPRAEPVRVREPRPVAPEASPETLARELLRRGATYDEVRRALLEERGRIVPDGTLRRLATELRKADDVRPIEEARSRSDVARALIREGLSYDQIEAAFAARGEKPLSRGQLRALKARMGA